jgi:hypothetical protein
MPALPICRCSPRIFYPGRDLSAPSTTAIASWAGVADLIVTPGGKFELIQRSAVLSVRALALPAETAMNNTATMIALSCSLIKFLE